MYTDKIRRNAGVVGTFSVLAESPDHGLAGLSFGELAVTHSL